MQAVVECYCIIYHIGHLLLLFLSDSVPPVPLCSKPRWERVPWLWALCPRTLAEGDAVPLPAPPLQLDPIRGRSASLCGKEGGWTGDVLCSVQGEFTAHSSVLYMACSLHFPSLTFISKWKEMVARLAKVMIGVGGGSWCLILWVPPLLHSNVIRQCFRREWIMEKQCSYLSKWWIMLKGTVCEVWSVIRDFFLIVCPRVESPGGQIWIKSTAKRKFKNWLAQM